jgi:hypothetical protein
MDHRLSFVVEIIRDDIGEVEEEKGNEGWLAESNGRGLVFIDAILIVFFARADNFSCAEEV